MPSNKKDFNWWKIFLPASLVVGLFFVSFIFSETFFSSSESSVFSAVLGYKTMQQPTQLRKKPAKQLKKPTQRSARSPIWNIPCASNPKPVFSHGFADYDHIRGIIQQGAAAGEEIKPHGYVDIDLNKGESIALYAPTDMELVEGAYEKEPDHFKAKTTYSLHFQISCEVSLMLDHITDPVEKIKQAFPKTPQSNTIQRQVKKPVVFKAGELIGYTMGGGSAAEKINRFDLGLYDTNHTNYFVNQARYKRSFNWKSIHAVCPYDYFSPELRDAYRRKFTTFEGAKPVPDAPCRIPNQDAAGTLSGAWFFNENDMSVARHVGIGIDLDGKSISIAGLPNGHFTIDDSNATFRNPKEIVTDHCFAYSSSLPMRRIIYFRFITPTKVEVYDGDSPSGCPDTFPSGKTFFLYR